MYPTGSPLLNEQWLIHFLQTLIFGPGAEYGFQRMPKCFCYGEYFLRSYHLPSCIISLDWIFTWATPANQSSKSWCWTVAQWLLNMPQSNINRHMAGRCCLTLPVTNMFWWEFHRALNIQTSQGNFFFLIWWWSKVRKRFLLSIDLVSKWIVNVNTEVPQIAALEETKKSGWMVRRLNVFFMWPNGI